MERQKTGRVLTVLTEWISLAVVMHFCIRFFLKSTMFRFQYPQEWIDGAYYALWAAAVLRTALGTFAAWKAASGRKERIIAVVGPVLVLLSLIPCFLAADRFGYEFLRYLPLAALCLCGMDAHKVLKIFTAVLGCMLGATVLCALSGCIRNLVYLREGVSGKVRAAYGICFPTDLAAYLVYWMAMLWCCSRKSSWLRSGVLAALAVAAAWFMNAYTDSRNSALCALLLAVFILWEKVLEAPVFRGKGRWAGKLTDGAAAAAFPLAAGATALLTGLYGKGVPLAVQVNRLLTKRLDQAWTAFQKYGVHALGAQTPQAGMGGKIVYDPSAYEFMDSSYALLLIRYGWILFLIVAFAWVLMTRKASRAGKRRIALALALIAVHSFAEHHLPEMNFNILLLMPLCFFGRKGEAAKAADSAMPAGAAGPDGLPAAAARKRTAAGWIAGALVSGGFLLLLPRMLSRARSLFSMIGWMDIAAWSETGETALKPLLGWVAVLCGLAAAWFVLYRGACEVFERKRPSPVTCGLLAAVVLAAVGGTVWVNRHIEMKKPAYEEQLSADEGAVRMVLEAAREPVWAGQLEELYRNRFGGIQYRLFSPEELSRTCRGSILMEHDQEGYQLMNTGAAYAELSAGTGLFTWDPAVIEKLSAAGVTFSNRYTAERQVDLPFFAKKNGLKVSGGGRLWISKGKPFNHGPYIEQYDGNYRVTFTLRLNNPEWIGTDREICSLRVASGFGEKLRLERIVTGNEFDADGRMTAEMHYFTENARGVEYLAFPREGIELELERVAWKRE